MSRVLALVGCLGLGASACLDVTLPAPRLGRVTGIVVISRSAGFETPARGAVVSVRQSSLSTTTNEEGFFELAPVPFADGFLDVQFDEDGDGAFDRWRVIAFADRGIRPGQESNLGSISLRDGATVFGRVELEGVPPGGHANTTISVPGMPAATFTFPTGDFTLSQLPEGPVQLAAFHPGYDLKLFPTIELRAGELLNLAPQTLTRRDGGLQATGVVSGTVVLLPQGDLSTVTVSVPGEP